MKGKELVALAIGGMLLVSGVFSQPWTPIDTNFASISHLVPASPVKSTILLRGKVDTVTNKNGAKGLVKDGLDFIGYIPINGRSDSGYVIVNHEQLVKDPVAGDGGGMTVLTAFMQSGAWKVAGHPQGKFRAVDFSTVGGTQGNCGGTLTPWGTVLTGEEWEQFNNSTTHDSGRGYQDTSDYTIRQFNGAAVNKTYKRYRNLNWMVEVDPAGARALKKHYNMGRFLHEGGYCMPDGKTVYLTDDYTPAPFLKFISDQSGNYDKGKLYAYRQTSDGAGGSWVELPMDLDSLLHTREMAFKRGATSFTRFEWAELIGGKLYLSETGNDATKAHSQTQAKWGSTIARHLRGRIQPDSTINDYFGRILRFDPQINKMDVFLEGGPGSVNKAINFANPDGLVSAKLGDKTYLVIQENLNGMSQGRVPPAAEAANRYICEMYWLDMSIASPKVDDLKRMVVGTVGAEITGARFTPDSKTMFVNMQHPASTNPAPYNTSYTLAIWGYEPATFSDPPRFAGRRGREVRVSVDALSRFVYFDRKTDVELFDSAGRRLERHKDVAMMDIQHLNPGRYFLRFSGKDLHKLTLQ